MQTESAPAIESTQKSADNNPLQQSPEVSAFDGSANTTPNKLQEMVTQNDDTVRNIKIDQKLTQKMTPTKRTSQLPQIMSQHHVEPTMASRSRHR